MDFAIEGHFESGFKGEGLGLNFLGFIPLRSLFIGTVGIEDKVCFVVLNGRVCGAGADEGRVLTGEASFFQEFAGGAGDGIFICIEGAAREFPGGGVCSVAKLVNEDDFSV